MELLPIFLGGIMFLLTLAGLWALSEMQRDIRALRELISQEIAQRRRAVTPPPARPAAQASSR